MKISGVGVAQIESVGLQPSLPDRYAVPALCFFVTNDGCW